MMDENYYKNLPKKRMAAGVLLFNERGELLVVKPNYRNSWLVPGGVVEEEESPREAVIREAREELGLELESVSFLCVDYCKDCSAKGESLQFVFTGETLNKDRINGIKIQEEELEEYRFVKKEESLLLVNKKLKNRLAEIFEVLENKTPIYTEHEY